MTKLNNVAEWNGIKKSPKIYGGWGRILNGLLPLVKKVEAKPQRMLFQPGGLFQLGQELYLNLVQFAPESNRASFRVRLQVEQLGEVTLDCSAHEYKAE